jgi:hypothetical protein
VSVQDDLAAAQQALAELERVTTALRARIGEGLDVHRLAEDVARVGADLQLVRSALAAGGQSHSPSPAAATDPSGEYDPAFWADADDSDGAAAGS